MQANILKQNSMNKFIAFKTTTQRLEKQTFTTHPLFQQDFAHLFSKDVRTFKFELSQNMQNLERQINKERLYEKDSKSHLSVIEEQSDKFIHSEVLKPSNYNSYDREVPYTVEYNVFAVKMQHSEQPESINDTHVMEKDDSNVSTDSSNMCDNENRADQNAKACDDERVTLANLIANLKLDIDENKKIQKKLKKTNASLTQELK
nr:hypothetical protein [Tanacetum cinerariifolium]